MVLQQQLLPVCLFAAQALGAAHPAITPAPSLEDRERALARRDLDPGSYIGSVLSGLGSDVSSYVASGVPQFFQDFPIGGDVEKALDIDDDDLKATPTQVLNIPGYANWTEAGWNARIHGNVYKQPNISRSKLDSLANKFLIGVDIDELPESQQDQARNLTAEIFVVQQSNESVAMHFVNNVDVRPDASGGVINAKGGVQSVELPYRTTSEGDFDAWLTLRNTTGPNGGYLMAGNATDHIQALNVVCIYSLPLLFSFFLFLILISFINHALFNIIISTQTEQTQETPQCISCPPPDSPSSPTSTTSYA